MTRAKIITITFLAGLIVGCAIPSSQAKAMPIAYTSNYEGMTVTAVHAKACQVDLDGDSFRVDCDSADLLHRGDKVTLVSRVGYSAIITEDGEEVEID